MRTVNDNDNDNSNDATRASLSGELGGRPEKGGRRLGLPWQVTDGLTHG